MIVRKPAVLSPNSRIRANDPADQYCKANFDKILGEEGDIYGHILQ